MSAKQAINDKLQGNVGTYLKCGRVVSNQIKEGLLLSPTVKKSRKIGEWQSYKLERDCLVMDLVRIADLPGRRRRLCPVIITSTACSVKTLTSRTSYALVV